MVERFYNPVRKHSKLSSYQVAAIRQAPACHQAAL